MNQLVEEPSSKFNLCVLPTQVGKTFTAINRIITEIDDQDVEFGRSVHIIFTMNTILNTCQFASRLQEIENKYGKGSVCVLSSKYSGSYVHVKNKQELQGLCFEYSKCPRVVVMCSNNIRFDDGIQFLKVVNENRSNIVRAFAYYDELHKYISDNLRKQIEELHSFDLVKGITALTASPEKIWKKGSGFWSKMQLIHLSNFDDTGYAGYGDMIFNCVDDYFDSNYVRPGAFAFDELDRQTIGFIEHVLEKYPDIIKKNTRTFIPAHVRRSGHKAVRDLIFQKNDSAVVVVINGSEKTIQYKDNLKNIKTIPLVSCGVEEVSETISRLISITHLQTRPLVITGYLCVGMGQTLTHKSMGSFTSAIFGQMNLANDEMYQLFGRITGRVKNWGSKYAQTEVYCPSVIMHRCGSMETCARAMVSDFNGMVVSHEDYVKPMTDMGDSGLGLLNNFSKKKNVTLPKDKNKNTTIPVKLEVNDSEFLDELVKLRTGTKRGYKLSFHNLLVKGISDGKITKHDNNNINKFDINSRKIKDVRMYQDGDSEKVRRFKQFNEAFDNRCECGQTCSPTEYNIDFAKDKYEWNDFVNETNIFWVTFRT
jgi:hypothetical protein